MSHFWLEATGLTGLCAAGHHHFGLSHLSLYSIHSHLLDQ